MSSTIAAVDSTGLSAVVESVTPAVFLDGVLEPGLSVLDYSASLPLSEATARVLNNDPQTSASSLIRHRRVVVAVPHLLTDGEVRWQVLLDGSAVKRERDLAVGKDHSPAEVFDGLATVLDEPASLFGPWPESGRSLAELVDRIGSAMQAEVVVACDPALATTLTQTPSPSTETLGRILTRALSDAGLILHNSLRFDDGLARRTLTVMAERCGRRVALPWPGPDGRGGAVKSVAIEDEQAPPRAWVAEGNRPVAEDTFGLQAGWDPAFEGEADAEYGRLTSADFSLYGAVYRAWVLNEDGAYSGAPYGLGDAFDIGALFGAPATVSTPTRLGSCLTRDAAGRPIPAVVESSTDSGSTWSAYPGSWSLMTDRAGVVLTDDELPASVLAAAKSGTLRLRVTATLTSPDPMSERRWDGNPFAGAAPTRVIRYGDRYAWRYVAPGSLHADAVNAGALTADTADDRLDMRLALQQAVAGFEGEAFSATVTLHGAWTALRAGDRAGGVLGRHVGVDGLSTRFEGRGARVRACSVLFGVAGTSPLTRITLD